MSNGLKSVSIRNYRCLADLHLPLGKVNVLFGPNGSGKSTFLDALAFVRDCAVNGVDKAASERGQGIGLLPENAEPDDQIRIGLETDLAEYEITFGFSSGRIELSPGEHFAAKKGDLMQVVRKLATTEAVFLDQDDKLLRRTRYFRVHAFGSRSHCKAFGGTERSGSDKSARSRSLLLSLPIRCPVSSPKTRIRGRV